MNKPLFVHWICFVLWLAQTKSIVILPYIQVEIFSPCFLHVHRLYDAAASPGARLRSPGSLAINKKGSEKTVVSDSMNIAGTIGPFTKKKVKRMFEWRAEYWDISR